MCDRASIVVISILCLRAVLAVQYNFNGSNTFGTMKICSRQRLFELLSVNHTAESGGIIDLSF